MVLAPYKSNSQRKLREVVICLQVNKTTFPHHPTFRSVSGSDHPQITTVSIRLSPSVTPHIYQQLPRLSLHQPNPVALRSDTKWEFCAKNGSRNNFSGDSVIFSLSAVTVKVGTRFGWKIIRLSGVVRMKSVTLYHAEMGKLGEGRIVENCIHDFPVGRNLK